MSNIPDDSPLLSLHSPDIKRTEEQVDARVAELLRENAVLEKRLSQALVNHEAADVSYQNALEQLKRAQDRITQLSTQNARLASIQSRLELTLQEKDDIQQERDSAAQLARTAEARLASLKQTCIKLQSQVTRLREESNIGRSERYTLADDVLSEARNRLQQLQHAVAAGSMGTLDGDDGITKVLESLVADNEGLTHDNAELQELLSSLREDLRAAQTELDERKASDSQFAEDTHDTIRRHPYSDARSSLSPTFNFGTAPAPSILHTTFQRSEAGPSSNKRSHSVERSFRRNATDATGWPNLVTSPIGRTFGDPSHDGQSEASSFDANPSVVGVIVERTTQLLSRLVQADALTLTNRLRRQRLLGADVSHLSRTTVSAILTESTNLRAQFRAFLEDDKVITTCTRRDLRALFKLFKDMFTEMGQLRVTLNDVILDPTVAGRVSEMAMHPSQAAVSGSDLTTNASNTPAWIAPISKFLGLPSGSGQEDAASRALSPPVRPNNRNMPLPPPRIVPKRGAALSASAMTVNVEFSGSGVGRTVPIAASEPSALPTASSSNQLSMISADSSRSVMDIFAGAPRAADATDPWVVVPKPRRGALGGRRFDMAGGATIGRSALRRATSTAAGLSESNSSGLSRAVDAVIDSQTSPSLRDEEARDVVLETLLERTLRPRGLSDSSIHTTFLNHAEPEELSGGPNGPENVNDSVGTSTGSKPSSMLQTLSRKMQNFRLASSSFAARPPVGVATTSVSTATSTAASSSSRPHTPETTSSTSEREAPRTRQPSGRSMSGSGLLTTIAASWAPSALDDEVDTGLRRALSPNFQVERPRDEDTFGRNWERGREM
ncbi:hypothetical protein EIP86_009608 [Pleurotus ostreatoroseus]|nr:hypothetical protein EIP86_009608 [Pleurotus ostreatoroseus]